MPERPWFRQAMSQTDPYELLRLQAGNHRRILDRAARLERALTIAASHDPALAELHQQAQQQRRHGALAVSTRLDELRALPSDLDVEQAADTIYALASPDVYLLLVRDRAWSPDNYEHWLAKRLQQSLIHDH